MKDKRIALLAGLIVSLLLIACGGTPTPVPIPPTSTPAPTPNTPKITIADTVFWLTDVIETTNTYIEAKPGYRLLEVGFQTDTGTFEYIAEIIKEFKTTLVDKDGNIYPSAITTTGLFCPGEGKLQVCWTYAVPETEKALLLSLPDGTTIELEPYIE